MSDPPDPSQRIEAGPPTAAELAADRAALVSPSRQAPAGPLFAAWAFVRQIGYLNIGIFAAVAGSRPWIAPVAAAVVLIGGVLRWVRYTYWLDGDELVTLSGVFSRDRVTVPLERIQSVSVRQNLMHRIFSLVEVKVQTAGSAGAEISLDAVRAEVGDRFRRLATASRPRSDSVPSVDADDAGPEPPRPILRRSTREIVLVALTRAPQLLFAPLFLVLLLMAELEEYFGDLIERAGDSAAVYAESAVVIAVGIAVALAVSALLMILFTVTRMHDLTITSQGESLRETSGLISRREFAVSVERVQAVEHLAGPLERLWGRSLVRLPVAGTGAHAASTAGAGASTAIGAFGATPAEERSLLELVLGEPQRRQPNTDGRRQLGGAEASGFGRLGEGQGRISALAWRRWTLWSGVVPALVAAVVVGLAASGWWRSFGLAVGLVWVAITAVLARRHLARWSWSIDPETVCTTNGLWTRAHRVVPVRKTQNVALGQGIFHRRHGLADVSVRTASNVSLKIPMLPLSTAHAVRDELIYRAETDPRPFI